MRTDEQVSFEWGKGGSENEQQLRASAVVAFGRASVTQKGTDEEISHRRNRRS
jgi:hypothetical protein